MLDHEPSEPKEKNASRDLAEMDVRGAIVITLGTSRTVTALFLIPSDTPRIPLDKRFASSTQNWSPGTVFTVLDFSE
jgi:hypothetical protein